MRLAHSRNEYALFADAWETALIPEGEIIVVRPKPPAATYGLLSVVNHGCGVLAVPCKMDMYDLIALDFDSPRRPVLELQNCWEAR